MVTRNITKLKKVTVKTQREKYKWQAEGRDTGACTWYVVLTFYFDLFVPTACPSPCTVCDAANDCSACLDGYYNDGPNCTSKCDTFKYKGYLCKVYLVKAPLNIYTVK